MHAESGAPRSSNFFGHQPERQADDIQKLLALPVGSFRNRSFLRLPMPTVHICDGLRNLMSGFQCRTGNEYVKISPEEAEETFGNPTAVRAIVIVDVFYRKEIAPREFDVLPREFDVFEESKMFRSGPEGHALARAVNYLSTLFRRQDWIRSADLCVANSACVCNHDFMTIKLFTSSSPCQDCVRLILFFFGETMLRAFCGRHTVRGLRARSVEQRYPSTVHETSAVYGSNTYFGVLEILFLHGVHDDYYADFVDIVGELMMANFGATPILLRPSILDVQIFWCLLDKGSDFEFKKYAWRVCWEYSSQLHASRGEYWRAIRLNNLNDEYANCAVMKLRSILDFDTPWEEMRERFHNNIGSFCFPVHGTRAASQLFLVKNKGLLSPDVVQSVQKGAEMEEDHIDEVFFLASGYCQTMHEAIHQPFDDSSTFINERTFYYLSDYDHEIENAITVEDKVAVCLWNGDNLEEVIRFVAKCSPTLRVEFWGHATKDEDEGDEEKCNEDGGWIVCGKHFPGKHVVRLTTTHFSSCCWAAKCDACTSVS